MTKLYMVIVDCGDGSNGIRWADDEKVINLMNRCASGEFGSWYAEGCMSGDGLQLTTLRFKSEEAMSDFISMNNLTLTTLEEMHEYLGDELED